ncbi:L-histidine N(alpha)-methyltransferase [Rhodobacteraceae bacterium 2CG4]|uniref:L-histidine N(Alpha)-methyltransferase n=1 Tax=Halovulum marinum TaxID=2662447 RepID=A0A6L5YXI1_9RHOB|nr:L-histidine N(alpha)-methyltransferase [Halovulum marinum]MSU89041.1 L-histidine N(alpha)-methyltransferase [Halovulum marinum]
MDAPLIRDRALYAAALDGLTARPKRMEAKWFYDARGSALFEQITRLPEYYPTRTEIAILRAEAGRIAALVPDGAALVEPGAGASVKTRILLDRLAGRLAGYVPLDISGGFLNQVAEGLRTDYPALPIRPVVADFMAELPVPDDLRPAPKVVFFPGSTIGNLSQQQAVALLRRARALPHVARMFLGLDLVKDPDTLVAAYDDAAGVTAAFNRNLLARLNRDAGGGFDPDSFAHQARWVPDKARIEMHLVSARAQEVPLGHETICFARGESIHTENCHKYTPERLEALIRPAGWRLGPLLTDRDRQFAVAVLEPTGD